MHAMRKNATYIERVSGMLEVLFHESVEDARLKYAVIISRADGRWVFCQHKERDTFECPGGHRDAGETIEEAARRELYEETGALDYTLKPLGAYSVSTKSDQETKGGDEPVQLDSTSYGMLYYAEIQRFGPLPADSEIGQIHLVTELPERWTYPLIQPLLLEKYARQCSTHAVS
jgi:8-oxo-dGTP diphosphatase